MGSRRSQKENKKYIETIENGYTTCQTYGIQRKQF